jgi:hypothetical protein
MGTPGLVCNWVSTQCHAQHHHACAGPHEHEVLWRRWQPNMPDLPENNSLFSRENVMFMRSIGCNLLVPGQGKSRQVVQPTLSAQRDVTITCWALLTNTCSAVTVQFVLTSKQGRLGSVHPTADKWAAWLLHNMECLMHSLPA